MAPGTNELPHPPVTLDRELLDKPLQAGLYSSTNLNALYFVGKILVLDYLCLQLFQKSIQQLVSKLNPASFEKSAPL